MIKIKEGFTGQRSIILPKVIISRMENDPLCSQLHVTDIGYYPRAEYHYVTRLKPIDQYVLIYCTDGSGWYKVDDQEFTVSANQYFILPAGKPHSYGASPGTPWSIYWMHFKGTIAAGYIGHSLAPISIIPGTHSRISDRTNLFEEIFTTLNMGYDDDSLHYVSSILHHYLGTFLFIQQYRNAAAGRNVEDSAISNAMYFMKENIDKKLSLEEISAAVGYSPSYFSDIFKKAAGHSPVSYFNILKIKYACQLFEAEATVPKVNQVCPRVGISDPYYFTRLFTKIMGMSPRVYCRTYCHRGGKEL